MEEDLTYTAFAGNKLIVSGDLRTTVLKTKHRVDGGETDAILIFDDRTGQQIDFDMRGSDKDALERLSTHPYFASLKTSPAARTGPGRPKLGVISREITLLPRHWEWLEQQPRGISAALRLLVDEARRQDPNKERARAARDAAGKFMWAMAGNLLGFEEASRALYAMDLALFDTLIKNWPKDIRTQLRRLVRKFTLPADGEAISV